MHTEIFYRLLCGDSVLTDENTMEITSAGMTFKEAFFYAKHFNEINVCVAGAAGCGAALASVSLLHTGGGEVYH